MNDLIIVEAAAGDAAAILAYRNAVGMESDNLTYGEDGPGTTLEEQTAYIRKMAESKGSVMYVGKIGMEIVALGTVSAFGKPRIRHRAELGLTVRKAFWNQGIATKMMGRSWILRRTARNVRSFSLRSGPITGQPSISMKNLALRPLAFTKNSLKLGINTHWPL